MSTAASPLMHVKVYAPLKTYYDREAASFSAENDTGPFDVLAGHKNFMTLLKPCVITVRTPNQPDFNLRVERGIVHVKADKTTVFLDV
jgi:F0F1-type ATP synthase epsilon subunit